MKIEYKPFNLELKNTFTISHGSRNFQPSLVVCIKNDGFTGLGEAAATKYYGVSVEGMINDLKKIEKIVQEKIDLKPEEVWDKTFPYLEKNLFAQCAMDIALHDLYAKRKERPLYKLWGLDPLQIPVTSYTIGLDTVDQMIKKIKDFPWPIYKIKLGTKKDDIRIIRELRKVSNAVFRIDANAGWSAKQTIENSFHLKELNVEFIEQPLKPHDIEGMKNVFKKSALPLIADESCMLEEDIAHCATYFHGVNIKLTKCGGITPAMRMIKNARKLGLKVMLGCMTESSIGISAVGHLAPLLDYVDMDGALLLKNDIADGIIVTKKGIKFPNRNGTGALLR